MTRRRRRHNGGLSPTSAAAVPRRPARAVHETRPPRSAPAASSGRRADAPREEAASGFAPAPRRHEPAAGPRSGSSSPASSLLAFLAGLDHLHRLVLRQPHLSVEASPGDSNGPHDARQSQSRPPSHAEAQRAPAPARRLDVFRRGNDAERHRRRARNRPRDGRQNACGGQGARGSAHCARRAAQLSSAVSKAALCKIHGFEEAIVAPLSAPLRGRDLADQRRARRIRLGAPAQRHENRTRLGPHAQPLARILARALAEGAQRRSRSSAGSPISRTTIRPSFPPPSPARSTPIAISFRPRRWSTVPRPRPR